MSATASSCWKSGLFASGDAGEQRDLGAGEGEDVVERTAGDAEGRAGHHATSDTNAGMWMRAMGLSMQGSAPHGDEGAIGRNSESVDPVVVAGGGAHAGGAPRVLDDDVIGREQRGAEHGVAVDHPFDAVAVDPVGVLASAGELHRPVDQVVTVGRRDGAGRVEGTGEDHAGPGREEERRRCSGAG